MKFNLKPLTFCLTLWLTMPLTHAQIPSGETHTASDIDPNAPIVALDKLQSLKHPSQLKVILPKIEHFTTQSGTPVAFVQTHNLPMVDIDIRFNAGSARDESIKPNDIAHSYGIASLTAAMLDQGTRRHNQDEFAELSEQLGINLNASAYRDMFVVSLRTLSDEKHVVPAVLLMQEMLSQPTFPQASLERTKAQYIVGLQKAQEDPDTIASNAFSQALYGTHPYAHSPTGTLESIPTINQQDLQAFAKRYLVAKNANLAITGDISLEQAKMLANQLTQVLPLATPAPLLPNAKPPTQAKTIHIPFDSTQTTVLIGQLGDKRSTDPTVLQHQTNFAIANDIVGGGNFQARLMADIRKKRGLTYGIYSGMTPMLAQGSYTISFSTRNEKAPEAIQATLNVLNNTLKTGVTQNELNLTKDSMINSFPLSFASNAGINNTLGMMGFYGLPDSYLSDYVTRINQATLHDVNHSFAQAIDTKKLLTVTVGGSK